MRKILLLGIIFGVLSTGIHAQENEHLPEYPPILKGYKGLAGKVVQNQFFNFIKLKDETGEKERQATGRYWDINYVYDSAFRQKRDFASFMIKQIQDNKGILFFKDTSTIHFAIPRDSMPNIWGVVNLKSDRVYRIKIIEEKTFNNQLNFDVDTEPQFDDFVEKIELPPRMSFLPNTVITSARYSKFNHYRISYIKDKRVVQQNLKGPYWDLKLKIVNETGDTDLRVSDVQIMESYYRAVIKSKGKVLKSKARELVFYLPVDDDKKLWVRIVTSLNGLYYVKMVLQSNEDEEVPRGATDTTKK